LKSKITALALCLNEAENVKRYVESLSFADEIIFIDSNSSDATVAIAKELGVKVIARTFDDFSKQRQYAVEQAKNDWIVFFDLDEIITPALAEKILDSVASPDNCVAFSVKRNLFFFGKKINFGGWRNDTVIRVFNKNKCTYNGHFVNENLNIIGKTGRLKSEVDHYSYKSFDSYNEKLNQYSKLQAESLYLKNKRPNGFHFFVLPFHRFCSQYLFRLGFLDGKEGFILAYLHSFTVFKCYLLLWLKYRKIE
jgi:glycosyltransferase involved in cell wall biosynthesis